MNGFHIDPETGDLVFPQMDVRLARLRKWKSLPAPLKALMGPDNDVRTGWVWRGLADLTFQGHRVGAMLGFHDGRLEMVNFSLVPAVDRDSEWPTYEESMEEERVLKKAMEDDLGVSLGPRGHAQFKWGAAFASYNAKDQGTCAGINYTYFR